MDLNRAATFVRVVESGSFTAAAGALHLPPSAVSRAVARLEGDLGVTLLERTTRKLSLTDAGRAYFERAREAVAGLSEAGVLAVDAAREPQGLVRLAAPPEMGGHLASVLAELLAAHPKLSVDVSFTSRGAELVGTQVDVAIVVGPLEDSSLIVKRLGTTAHRMFASAAYLERRGKPRAIADLARHACVLFRGQRTWELHGPKGKETVEVDGPISGDHLSFVYEAVSLGHGIGLLPAFLAHKEPALTPVLPTFAANGGLHSLVNPSRHMPQRVRVVRDFLGEKLATACTKGGACG
jgi:DNA-binding transcriptional LysR family regulator